MHTAELKELLTAFWDERENTEDFLYRSFGELHYQCAEHFEIDGYFNTKFEEEARRHPVSFNEAYFEDPHRNYRFILEAAFTDPQVLELLNLIRSLAGLRPYNLRQLAAALQKARMQVAF